MFSVVTPIEPVFFIFIKVRLLVVFGLLPYNECANMVSAVILAYGCHVYVREIE